MEFNRIFLFICDGFFLRILLAPDIFTGLPIHSIADNVIAIRIDFYIIFKLIFFPVVVIRIVIGRIHLNTTAHVSPIIGITQFYAILKQFFLKCIIVSPPAAPEFNIDFCRTNTITIVFVVPLFDNRNAILIICQISIHIYDLNNVVIAFRNLTTDGAIFLRHNRISATRHTCQHKAGGHFTDGLTDSVVGFRRNITDSKRFTIRKLNITYNASRMILICVFFRGEDQFDLIRSGHDGLLLANNRRYDAVFNRPKEDIKCKFLSCRVSTRY